MVVIPECFYRESRPSRPYGTRILGGGIFFPGSTARVTMISSLRDEDRYPFSVIHCPGTFIYRSLLRSFFFRCDFLAINRTVLRTSVDNDFSQSPRTGVNPI